jgi:protein TonB
VIGPVRWLPLSLIVHAAALGGVVLLARESAEAPLFVDLTLQETPADRGGAGSPRGGDGEPARPAPAPAKPAAPPARAAVTPAAPPVVAAPTPPAAPVPSLPPDPPAVSAPPSAPVASAPSIPAPVASAPQAPASASSQAGGTAVEAATNGPSGRGDETATGAGAGPDAVAAASAGRGGDGMLALAVPGDGGGTYGPYLAALRRRVQESLEYPAAARRRGLSGTVHLEIALDVTGRVSEVVLARSSSHALLDDAALAAARAISRIPFPSDVRPRALRVRLPVVFELR